MTARLIIDPSALAAALLPGWQGRSDDGRAPGSDPTRYPGFEASRLARRLRILADPLPRTKAMALSARPGQDGPVDPEGWDL